MKVYRILTEDVNREKIMDIVADYGIDSATFIPAIGTWKRTRENSLIIEIMATDSPENHIKVNSIAGKIREVNKQEVVLVQEVELVNHYFRG